MEAEGEGEGTGDREGEAVEQNRREDFRSLLLHKRDSIIVGIHTHLLQQTGSGILILFTRQLRRFHACQIHIY
jgi:hypothetical protein